MSEPRYLTLLTEPAAFWAANGSSEKVPDIVRCGGIEPIKDLSKLTIYISQHLGRKFLQNLTPECIISLSATSVPTFESYQYKGPFENIRPCTPAEEEQQRIYLKQFGDVTSRFGYDGDGLFRAYWHVPAFAVTFLVQDIFEQTPKKGTGENVKGANQ